MVEVLGGQNVERYFRDLAQKVRRGGTLAVGFMSGATYPDGTSVPMVAALLEFGTAKAGPWPYFRGMIAQKSAGWGPAAGKLLVQNNYDVRTTLTLMGEGIKGQLQQSIRDIQSPALKPSTIKRKGFSKPLIETSQLLNSATYRVTIR